MTVRIDKEVLAATVVALDDLAADLPGLFSRAGALDARIDMAGLNGAQEWAQDTSKDLQGRIGVLEQLALARPSFGGVAMTTDQAMAIAGQSMHVEDALLAVRTVDPSANAWDDADPANMAEWFEKLEAEAIAKLAKMTDSEQAEALVDAYNDVQDLITAGGATVAAVGSLISTGGAALANWLAQRQIVQPVLARVAASSPGIANWLTGALNVVTDNYLRGKVQFKYPGSFVPNMTQKLLLQAAPIVENFDAWVARMSSATKAYEVNGALQPTLLAKLLTSAKGVTATTWVSNILTTTQGGQLAQRLAGWGNNVFGRAWTNPTTGVLYGRGGGNLVSIANQSGLRTMASSAGALRILGVAGSAYATLDGAVGLYNNREENRELWSEGGTSGKAHVVGEYAEVAFNASMTAALIAPNPVTLGLVAVSGGVWVGAKVVEHWDDVERAADATVDWVADRAEDTGAWVGDQVDAVKKSELNPMNWF